MAFRSERQQGESDREMVTRLRRFTVVSIMFLCDLLALVVACMIPYGLRLLFGPLNGTLYLKVLPALFLFPLAYFFVGLYPGYGINMVEQLRLTFRATTLVSLLLVTFSVLVEVGNQFSRPVLVGWWFLASVFVPLARALLRSLLSRTSLWGEPVIVLGAARTGEVIVNRLLRNPGLGLRPVAYLDDDPGKHGTTTNGVPVVGPLSLAPALARTHGSSHAIVAMPGLGRTRLTDVVGELSTVFPHIITIPDLLGLTSLWVSTRDMHGILGLELRQNLLFPLSRYLKRALDLAITIPALIVVGPIISFLGWLVKMNSPGPAFYGQIREGLNGRQIRVWKLRTMVPNAEAKLQDYLRQNPQAKAEWDRYMKLKDDPRIVPRVGHFLRRFSLDELPQLWNVIRGDMSLVGPRPFPDYHLAHFSGAFRALRRRVLPGLTGVWQVSARSDSDHALTEELDTYYIRNWSLWLDIYLLARTVTAVLFGKGAY